MSMHSYDQAKKMIITLQFLAALAGMASLILDHTLIVYIAIAFLLLSGILSWFLCERCIRRLVTDLTALIDALASLKQESIFPENEDTMLSKLQFKIKRLIHMLIEKEKLANQSHENMKGLIVDISHQLKTPISNLLMYTEFLKDPSLSDDSRQEYNAIVRLSVERLSFLTEHMVKLSRLESGLICLHPEKQSINETILKAIKDIFPKAQNNGRILTYEEETSLLIHHDRNWTAEALFNIMDNAIKYSNPGSTVQIHLKHYGMFAAIEITNEGTNIDETEQTRIFTRFYRGKNSRQTEGIGIGLYLSREILVRQGGYISLKVQNGLTTFLLCLPVEATQYASNILPSPKPTPTQYPLWYP